MHYHPYNQFPVNQNNGDITIGFGRNLKNQGIAYDEAEGLLIHDLAVLKKQLLKFNWFTEQPESVQIALHHLAYSMQFHKLLTQQEFLRFMRDKNYTSAAMLLLEFEWAKIRQKQAKDIANEIRQGRY